MSRERGLALPMVLGIGLLAGCGPGESSSVVTTTETAGTTETADTTETVETTSDTGESTAETTSSTLPEEPLLPCPEDPEVAEIDESNAVFARADAPGPGDGTRAAPFTSLQAAVDAATQANKKVFACAAAPFEGTVVVSAPLEIRGGFDCDAAWAYDPLARSVLRGDDDTVALMLTSEASGAFVIGWQVEAPDAIAPGASSIAVSIDDVAEQTSLCRCDLIAGNAQKGADGAPWQDLAKSGVDAAMAGEPGAANDACVDPAVAVPGAPGVLECDDGISSGGLGGKGGLPPAGAGTDGGQGLPDYMMGYYGDGGKASTLQNGCKDGFDAPQSVPPAAPGAGGKGAGVVSLTGVKNVDGKPGATGSHGQGGGGGGAGTGTTMCPNGLPGVGASGGGGGSGGCGGKGGRAGQAGGSSIGLVVQSGDIFLATVTITTGDAGDGGNGGLGQLGGQGGGNGGPAGNMAPNVWATAACAGGKGGPGGQGGLGGGGQGGDSVSIAAVMSPGKLYFEDYSHDNGKAGKGGNAGVDYPEETSGASGVAGQLRIFPGQP